MANPSSGFKQELLKLDTFLVLVLICHVLIVVAMTCGPPPAGFHTKEEPSDFTANFSAEYIYECLPGFESSTCLQTFCLADGSWSVNPPPDCNGKIYCILAGRVLKSIPTALF